MALGAISRRCIVRVMASDTHRAPRQRMPTTALDFSLAALAKNDPEACLRRAVPALEDVGAGASAADIVARAAVSLGNMKLARLGFETAARALALQGVASHAIAAALAVTKLTSSTDTLREIARVFGADAGRHGAVSVHPPPLWSDSVAELSKSTSREELFSLAEAGIKSLSKTLPGVLPARGRHALWGLLPTEEFVRFARSLEVRLCPSAAYVIRQGDRAGGVYIIARGEIRVARSSSQRSSMAPIELGLDAASEPLPEGLEELAVLGADAVFGEMALLTAEPRSANVITTRASLLLEASSTALETAEREVPELARMLLSFGRQRLIQNLLRTSPLLIGLSDEVRPGLAAAFETQSFTAGEELFPQGAEGVGLYLIASGRVEAIRSDEDTGPLVLGQVGAGGCVGEISMVLRRPTTAAVVAIEPTTALVLGQQHFISVAREHPALLASLYELAVSRDDIFRSVVGQAAESADDLVML